MTKYLVKLALPMLLVISTQNSFSKTITVEQAKDIAAEFVNSCDRNVELQAVLTAGTPWKPAYYVFNGKDNSSFVIISAEDCTTPVLGYSFDNAYPVGNVPQAMQWMMEGMQRELEVAPTMQTSQSVNEIKLMARKAAVKAVAADEEKVLATPAWSQEAPFNAMIPGKPLVGCVGTAMATIMKYHEWPQMGKGSRDDVNFNVAYDWNSMRADNYRQGYTQAEGDAVATLMYHASKSIDTQYAMSGSSAYEVRVPAALSTFFGYDPGVSYKKRAEVASQEAWDRIVKDEIDAGRPVLYCGQDVTAGHAFVCDGYRGEFLHFNWGWGGQANGFFLSTALNPVVSKSHQYNNLNTIIYNIKPATGAVAEWSPIHITADGNQVGIGSDMTDLSQGKSFKLRVGNLKNLSYDDFTGKIAVALTGADGAMKALLSTPSSFSLVSMATLYNGYVDFNNCALPAGTAVADGDCVRIMTQAAGSDAWLPVAGELLVTGELAPKTTAATFAVSLPAGVDGVTVEGEDAVIKGWNYQFKVTPANPQEDVVTVKANGYVLTPGASYTYTIDNVRENQEIAILVQKAADVKEKRSYWVGTPGTLSTIITDEESGTIKELTLFGTLDARDFAFMKSAMRLTHLDLSGVYISAHGSDQANAIPREAFRGMGTLNEVILPSSINRLNNGCFRQCGITTITIPAGVKTYEYNVFVGASRLRDIYVGRETAEFINWCVLSGVKVAQTTLHVPSEKAAANYAKAENWNTIGNIVVDPIKASDDVLFAVMDDADVKYESETSTGRLTKGTEVRFTSSYIPDNDNRMEVYANSTLLTPAADGTYSTTLNGNTIIHFELLKPTEVDSNKSKWTLTDKRGSVGLLTDAVNVIPGQEFQVRVNTLNIPQYFDQLFWAMALTDASGNIKEFISPINLWTAGAGDNFRMNVNCCVKESKVREGNMIRLVTSGNKRNWNVVEAVGEDMTDALAALNNQTPVYNINIAEVADATVSGLPESGTAVRGRDITLKINPKSAAYRVDLSLNGKQVLKNQAAVDYTFVVKEDINIDVDVYDPKAEGVLEMTVAPGTFHVQLTEQNVCATVILKGEVYSSDIQHATGKDFAINTIKTLDLRGVKIVAQGNYEENVVNHPFFVYPNGMNTPASVIENIYLPDNVVRIAGGVFKNCANIKEITLPKDLRSVPIKPAGSNVYQYGLASDAFLGCNKLTTIRIPGAPGEYNGRSIVAHHNPYSTYNPAYYQYYNLGHEDPKKVTVIVPEEYLSVYTTAYKEGTFGNPWKGHGYNILAEYPVYGINFDPTRVKVTDDEFDITTAASFLGDNVALDRVKVEGKLALANPEINCRVYDNGNLIEPAADGSISVEFLNPAKNKEGVGNHEIKVVYLHDITFKTSSPLFSIAEPQVYNNEGNAFHTFDTTDALTPVLKNVAENSSVRFGLALNADEQDGLEARVMQGQQELQADDDGFYTLDVTGASVELDVYAVPTNGAHLNREELAAINPSQSAAVTDIALTGDMTTEELAHAMECFPALETLDLSEYTGSLPEGILEGMTELTTVALPPVESIPADMFKGCTSLESVDIPATVNEIGEGAFKNCESLTTVRLTGITAIGSGAFEGCDNLTTITLLADANVSEQKPAARKMAMSRAGSATISPDAFKGVNPNCIIVLDEGVTKPEAMMNFITTATGTVTEQMPDGTVTEREGRVYSAGGDINLVSGFPLAIPHAFSLDNNHVITLDFDADGWKGLVVPFDVESISDADGNEIEVKIYDNVMNGADNYLMYAMAADGSALESVNTIKANTPCLFHSPVDGKVKFTATAGKISATPSIMSVEGEEFTLNASYAATNEVASQVYLLANDGYAFTAAGTDEESVSINPFEVYATSPVALNDIVIDMAGQTAGNAITLNDSDGLSVARDGDTLIVYATQAGTLPLYTVDGRVNRILNLTEGRNEVKGLATGIYLLGGTKIRF